MKQKVWTLGLIASTSKDLKSYVSLGLFLDDLFNRISIEEIHIPSLIDRKKTYSAIS